ncbi:hypothetical protein RHMOL_Rhmol01G0320300 [Rhododendron molle]|uniref:Uncharacterized protein n=1 Tax=Rhododendron molle TaxID=49168 RepID=A0ACC0Q9V5_RHOML|nr:hypothetical protein RHMOL_Rhmol01G0320300 [Rhododendron molle]
MDTKISNPQNKETPSSPSVDIVMETPPLPQTSHDQGSLHSHNAKLSFKAALVQPKRLSQDEIEKRIAEFGESDDENEDMEDNDTPPTKSKIKITFSKERLKRSRAQWRGCLIIKLLGKNLGFKPLMDRIHRLWNLEGTIVPIDVEMQKLMLKDDKERRIFDPEIEALLHTEIVWWAEGACMKIKINEATGGGQYQHRVKLKPLEKPPVYHRRIFRLLDLAAGSSLDETSIMPNFNILIWNCRGAGNDNFKRHFSELIRTHKPKIVGILETKVTFRKMGLFFKHLGFSGFAYVDPYGRAGGIWIVWDTSKVSLNITHASSQAIHTEITKDGFEDWVLSTVYASPDPKNRDILWEEMDIQAHSSNKPWLVAGDLNDTLNSSERRSFAVDSSSSQRRKFVGHVNNCNLVDLGFSGPKFTWNNGRKGMANVQKRLDRALCNEEWRNLFPEGMVQTLLRTYSDHSPILIHVFGKNRFNPIRRPFRMEAAWFTNPSFEHIVANAWQGSNIFDCIKQVSKDGMAWNKDVFGNIFRRKRWVLARLEGVQKSMDYRFSHSLQCFEKDLITEFNEILTQEEILWFQKSRAK